MGSYLNPTQFPGTPADRHRSPDDNCGVIRTLIGGDVPAFRVPIVTTDPGVEFSVNSALAGLPRILVVGRSSCARQARMAFSQVEPDLILVDVDSPGTGGIDFLHEVKASNPAAEVIVVSASADPKSIQRAVGFGCNAYLIKPFSSSQCQATIQWVLHKRSACPHPDTTSSRPEGLCVREKMGCCPRLGERERSVLRCLTEGLLYNKEIASQLQLSLPLVEKLVHRVLMRFGVHNRTEASFQWLNCASCPRGRLELPGGQARALPDAGSAARCQG